MKKWTPFSKKLPEYQTKVIVGHARDKTVTTGYVTDSGVTGNPRITIRWYDKDREEYLNSPIDSFVFTHWCDWPKPPSF